MTVEVYIQEDGVVLKDTRTASTIALDVEAAVEVGYKILLEYQTIEQIMDYMQSDIDENIERERGF